MELVLRFQISERFVNNVLVNWFEIYLAPEFQIPF